MSEANKTIIGTIEGYGPGIIYVADHKTGQVIALDRSSIIKHLSNGLSKFTQPSTKAQHKTTTIRPASRR